MISLKIHTRLFIYLVIAFIVASIIGTLSHEAGHYTIARLLGYNAEINYESISWWSPDANKEYRNNDFIFIVLGGPLQTIITGTTAFLFLLKSRKKNLSSEGLSKGHWILIFLSLFWLRQAANFIMWTGTYFFTGKFSERGDEIKLARFFGLPDGTIISITALIAFLIITIIVFKVLPVRYRTTFIVAGLVGGVAGYFLWFKWLGKTILP